MKVILVRDAALIAEVSSIAYTNHSLLRDRYPWLPEKKVGEFIPRVEWMAREGRVYALEDGDTLRAFLGWFKIDDFRNLGVGSFTPDWCFGVASVASVSGTGREVSRLMSPLVRRLMNDLKGEGIPIHAISVPSTSEAFIEEFSLLGYGRIVLDAARPTEDLLALPCAEPEGFSVRRAEASDAKDLADLDARLAAHIGSPPVLMPGTHGSTIEEWKEWIAGPDALTFVAETEGRPVGFIKADPPHFDVSWFVHGESTLAICGLYVDPSARGRGIGENLLRALVSAGGRRGYSLVSVDCETHNPEARAFWTSRFKPVSWSFERRF